MVSTQSTSAFREVYRYFKTLFSNLKPYHFNDRLSDLSKSTSPGRRFKSLGTKADVLRNEKAVRSMRLLAHKIKTGKLRKFRPVVDLVSADHKLNLDTGKQKSRIVWVFPIEVTAIENMFFAALKDRIPSTWVPRPATHHDLFCSYKSKSYDFTQFDAHVSRPIIRLAFSILRDCFDFSEYQCGSKPYSKTSLNRLWAFVVDNFIYTTYAVQGRIYNKKHGVPSGSMFTNLIDTIASRYILTCLHRIRGCNADICTYGDDCHVTGCVCNNEAYDADALFDVSLKVVAPNEHGCLTYCKSECHLGGTLR